MSALISDLFNTGKIPLINQLNNSGARYGYPGSSEIDQIPKISLEIIRANCNFDYLFNNSNIKPEMLDVEIKYFSQLAQ